MPHMPVTVQPAGVDVGDLADRVTALEAVAGGALNVTTHTDDRPTGLPFRPSTTNYTLVSYTAGLTINASPDDAGMFLISDASTDPQTVRLKATFFNPAIGSGALYAGCRSNLASYLVPPGHYVKLQTSLAGPSAQASILHVVEHEMSFGSGGVVVNQDGPDNVYVPESNAEFTELGLEVPDALWLMQDASGNPVDEHGWCQLTASGTVSYGNTETGWTRKFLGTTDATAGRFTTSSSTLPNPATTSLGVFALIKVSTPAATRSLVDLFANDLRVRVTTSPALQIFVDGGSTADGNVNPTGSVIPVYLQYDFTNQTAKIFTHQETISSAWVVGASRAVIFGNASAAATARYGYAFAYYDDKAEMTNAEVKAMFEALGWTVAWSA